ncbi:MAG TPA: serine hydrolase domain-containing protein [Solirubrobacteraceae bacterium]|jgi:CubicO group peptidase (beta-lactamase class C family)|nr:serine hydrolase domain-containing protein [Solirubrobacteraceae bacterium]
MPRIPRLPFVPDPLGRIHVPSNLKAITTTGEEAPPEESGLTGRQVGRIWAAARALYQTGVHPALQLCVRRNGNVVIDRAIGHARGNGPKDAPDAPKALATPDTPFCLFSTSKGITALIVHLLQDRGLLDISDRVTDYIPQYGRHGKGDTTIAHVLAHRAAVPSLPPRLLDLESLGDRELVIQAISDAKPFVKPGTLLAYHAVTGGLILGEIVERVTGKSLRQVLADEILEPLRFRWGNYGVAAEDADTVGLNYVTGPKLVPPFSNLVKRALSQSIEEVVALSNQPRFQTAVIPSASIITTANELSRFFEIFRCGGELDGVRVMQPETLRRALTEQSHLEIDLTLGFPTRFSYGLMLGAKVVSPFGLDTDLAFGHLGLLNIMGWADPERGVSVGLINSGKALIYPDVFRFLGVMQTIASEVPKLAASERPF